MHLWGSAPKSHSPEKGRPRFRLKQFGYRPTSGAAGGLNTTGQRDLTQSHWPGPPSLAGTSPPADSPLPHPAQSSRPSLRTSGSPPTGAPPPEFLPNQTSGWVPGPGRQPQLPPLPCWSLVPSSLHPRCPTGPVRVLTGWGGNDSLRP